jgi:glutamine synthetase
MAAAERPHGLSEEGESFAAGVLHHLPALLAITAASPNSYRRIAPSTWSGAYCCWGEHNREAPLRLVGDAGTPRTLNFEVKCWDATSNPHLGLAVLVAAGLLGMRGKMKLPAPVNVDPGKKKNTRRRCRVLLSLSRQLTAPFCAAAKLSQDERAGLGIARLPETLEAAVDAAESDKALLAVVYEIVGGSEDLVRAYFAVKRSEVDYFQNITPDQEARMLCTRY